MDSNYLFYFLLFLLFICHKNICSNINTNTIINLKKEHVMLFDFYIYYIFSLDIRDCILYQKYNLKWMNKLHFLRKIVFKCNIFLLKMNLTPVKHLY